MPASQAGRRGFESHRPLSEPRSRQSSARPRHSYPPEIPESPESIGWVPARCEALAGRRVARDPRSLTTVFRLDSVRAKVHVADSIVNGNTHHLLLARA